MVEGKEVLIVQDRLVALSELETRFAMAVRQRELLENYIRERLHPDKHFYTVGDEPGRKPSLTKEGAELICLPHNLKGHYEWLSGPDNPPMDDSPYQITMKCIFENNGKFEGEGVGSASSMVTKKDGTRVQRQKDPGLRHNATIKMACKCLAGWTPIFYKTEYGCVHNSVAKMHETMLASKEPIWLPSPEGWVKVLTMQREDNRKVREIELADGSKICATPEHRFPLANGSLVQLGDVEPSMVLVRSRIPFASTNGIMQGLGWTIGMYLAEGCPTGRVNAERFHLHEDEQDIVSRVTATAHQCGATTGVERKAESHGVALRVNGKGFSALMHQFISGKTSHSKHISLSSWRQGEGFLKELLDGYLQGDAEEEMRHGRIQDKWIVGFTGHNHQLERDLRLLCAGLNYRCSIHFSINEKGYPIRTGWISKSTPKYNGKVLEEVVAVREVKSPATVFDIEVDSGEHVFLLPNGIITHNSAYIAATLNSTAASEFFTQDLEDDQTGETAKQQQKGHWCKEHQTPFFMKGKMKSYAHPIGDTDKWCHEHKEKPQEAPESKPEAEKEPVKDNGHEVDLATLEFKNAGEFKTACSKHFGLSNSQIEKEVPEYDLANTKQRAEAWQQIVAVCGQK